MNTSTHTSQMFFFDKPISRRFTSGNNYMIIYISKGTCHFNIEETDTFCTTEDIILLKPNQKTSMNFSDQDKTLELIVLKVSPDYLKKISTTQDDLLHGFEFVPFKVASVHSDSAECMLIKNIAAKLAHIQEESDDFCHTLYEKNLCSIVLILTIRACIHADKVHRRHRKKHLLMDEVFVYIREHLTEDLTLEKLEQKFYVSRYHICREFKKATGMSPHAYIVKGRLDLCRKYIEEGKPVLEVYKLGGFAGYNHFFKAFKKEYGMTPKEYYKKLK